MCRSLHSYEKFHILQTIKHGAKIQPESSASNFISNISFLKRYSSNIYGITRTLLLNNTHNVDDSIVIPPFKFKQHKELMPIIVHNKSDWYKEIVKSCLLKLFNGRAVLMIANHIQEAEALEKFFINSLNYDSSKIITYKTNNYVKIVDRTLQSGDVLITTNIAGIGTDIKISDAVNSNGGLYVCLTFLPLNSRGGNQNKDRTGRTGNPGTSQFVLFARDKNIDINNLKENHEIKEQEFMEKSEKDINVVSIKDDIFVQLRDFLNQEKGRSIELREIERMALEERFAIWMGSKINTEPAKDILKNFQQFGITILKDDQYGQLIKNPYLCIKIGNIYVNLNEYKRAIDEYTLAINLDENCSENAYFNRGYAYIAEYGNDIKNPNIDAAISDFNKARSLIKQRESDLCILQCCSNNEIFSKQITNKLNLYNIQTTAIDEAIGSDIESIDKQLQEIRQRNTKNELSKVVSDLEEKKKKIGIIKEAKNKNIGINIKHIKLEKSFSPQDISSHNEEIKEFQRNGFIGSFEISKMVKRWDIITSCATVVAQLIAGLALLICTAFIWGPILIMEGIKYICTAITSDIINGTVGWTTWGIQKVVSLTTSGISVALNTAKDFSRASISRVLKGFENCQRSVKPLVTETAPRLISWSINKIFTQNNQETLIKWIKKPVQKLYSENAVIKKMLRLDKKKE